MANDYMYAPFTYFGGKSLAVPDVWAAFGKIDVYVEPFAGSAAMLLGAPPGDRKEIINDADGFIANFWRAIAHAPDEVAKHADWPLNEVDKFARHSWLVNQKFLDKLHGDPDWYDAKIAGWWAWGMCCYIGGGFCDGKGSWVHNGETLVHRDDLEGSDDLPGVSRQIPNFISECGVNRVIPDGFPSRQDFLRAWFVKLSERLREVRVACGDWQRVVKDSVTVNLGVTGIFFDPPYFKGKMNYTAGGVGTNLSQDVADWCAEHTNHPKLKIVICGHDGEHNRLEELGWNKVGWKARKGYSVTKEADENRKSESLWLSPNCVGKSVGLFDDFI